MEDFISQLPDELLQRILLTFSTRDSVRTSVLSSRWRNLWKGVPGLHLIGEVCTNLDVKDFLDRFLKESSAIHQFTLMCNDKDLELVDEFWWKWLIDKVVARGVQCFALDGSAYNRDGFFGILLHPVSFFKCETLVHLSLESVKMREFDEFQIFNLPRLETIHLKYVRFSSAVALERLISCSPLLQDLSIHDDTTVGRWKLRSQTVKRLSLRGCIRPYCGNSRVVIDTPSLEFLCIRDYPLENFRLESASSSVKMCIDVCSNGLPRMQDFHNFFAGVTHLTLSSNTLERIYPHFREPQGLPDFHNLTHLNVCVCSRLSEMLPIYLSSCPNLKSLDLGLHGYPKMEEIASSPVPRCFQTSLEYVEIKMTPQGGQEISRKAEVEFAKYMLENAKVLKKLTLWLDGEEDESSSVLERELAFPYRNRSFVEVKMDRLPAKFRQGYGFEFKPFFDPFSLFNLLIIRFLRSFG